MRRVRELAVWFLGSTMPALACMWSYEHDINGHQVALNLGPPEMYLAQFERDQGPDYWESERKSFQAGRGEYSESMSDAERAFRNRNDEAVALAHLGRAKEALQILLKLEKQSPGRYQVAANLGTSFELAGDNRKALFWITEAIQRNPESHQGTEWLHQKILEAKIHLQADPRWLQEHTILGYDFGDRPAPQLPAQLVDQQAQDKLTRALEYQLGERLTFVKPPDPIVADLLVDLAYLRALNTSSERGIQLLTFAQRYRPVRADVVNRRLQALKDTVAWGKSLDAIRSVFYILAPCALLWWVGRSRRRAQTGESAR